MKGQSASELRKATESESPQIIRNDSNIERMEAIYNLIAERAYALFDGRGGEHGHDLEDWLRAEAEVLHPVPVEIIDSGDKLIVRAEVPGFAAKDIKINLEPRRLTISGQIDQTS